MVIVFGPMQLLFDTFITSMLHSLAKAPIGSYAEAVPRPLIDGLPLSITKTRHVEALIRMIDGKRTVGNMVATIPSYYLNRTWTWGKKGRSHFRGEILPFWLMAALGTTFSIFGATLAGHMVSTHNWHHLVNTAIVAFANLVSFGIFWVLKLKVFNRIFHVDELAEMDEHLASEETNRVN